MIMTSRFKCIATISAVAFALSGAAATSAFAASDQWLTSWACPAQDPGTTGVVFTGATTVRDTLWATLGGDQVRVKFSNAFGAQPLVIGTASIGLKSGEASVLPASLQPLTFGGNPGVTVPQGGLVISDPVALSIPDLTDVSISVFLPNGAGTSVKCPNSMKTTYIYAGGDVTLAPVISPTSTNTASSFFLGSVEVGSSQAAGVVAAVGDSITQGVGTTVENAKWSDRLAARLQALSAPHHMGVLGLGIAGNRVLSGASTNPAALARFDRDVLGMAGLTHIILYDGINDLGSTALSTNPDGPPLAEDVEYGLLQLIERAHARGVKVIGTTMGPDFGFRGYENVESKRLAFNAWMRTEGVNLLDGLIDFDAVLRDPNNPSHMRPEFLTDGIHPNNAGTQAMANAINLLLFR
jgi:lysophospholipase L1-like esterase